MEPNESWLDHLKTKLENYSEELPEDGWSKLEAALAEKKQRKIIWLFPKKGWAAVAAVMFFALVPASLLNENKGLVDYFYQKKPIAMDGVNEKPSVDKKIARPLVHTTKKDKDGVAAAYAQPSSDNVRSTANDCLPKSNEVREEVVGIPQQLANSTIATDTLSEQHSAATFHSKPKEDSVRMITMSDILKSEVQDANLRSKNSTWLVGLTAVVGSTSKEGSANEAYLNRNSFYTMSGNNLLFIQPDRIKHRLPLSVGVSIDKLLSKKLSIETGIAYTYLSSDIFRYGIDKPQEQQLHYLGIPLRMRYSVLSGNYFSIYTAVGGMVEKCIAGSIEQNTPNASKIDIKDDKLQYSLAGSIGMQYNLTKHVGFYLEPLVSYYFDNHSSVKNVYKDKPLGVNVRIGVRVIL